MSHWINGDGDGDALDGSYCYWNHDGEPLKPSISKAPPQQETDRLISRPR